MAEEGKGQQMPKGKALRFDIVDFLLSLLGFRKRRAKIEIKPAVQAAKPPEERPEAVQAKRPAAPAAAKKKRKKKAHLKKARKKPGKPGRIAKAPRKARAAKIKRKPGKRAERPKAAAEIPKIPGLPEAIRLVYESAEKDEGAIEEDISTTKKLLERIENQFFKREISEEDYGKRKSELEEKLFVLEEKRKNLQKRKMQLANYAQTAKEERQAKAEMLRIKNEMQKLGQDFSAGETSEEAYGGAKAAYESKLFELKRKARKMEEQRISAERELLGKAEAEKQPSGIVELPKGTTARPEEKIEMPEMKRKPRIAKPPEKKMEEGEKPAIEKVIEAKASGIINEDKLKEIEEHIEGLMKKYNIPENELEGDIGAIRTEHLLEDLEKLIDIMELEHRTLGLVEEGPGEFAPARIKREEAKAIIKEIKKHRIVTDFDRILQLVNEKGRVRLTDVIKQLGVERKRADEVLEILEDENQVRVDYSPVGGAWISAFEYKKPKPEDGKKKVRGFMGALGRPKQLAGKGAEAAEGKKGGQGAKLAMAPSAGKKIGFMASLGIKRAGKEEGKKT